MRWINLFHLSSRLIQVTSLILVFVQCDVDNVDKIPASLSLSRGRLYVDPVVQTAPTKLALIPTVNNQFDINMEQSKFKGMPKPPVAGKYDPVVVETITQKALSAHLFQWKSTRQPVVMVALFREVVKVDTTTSEISNKEDLVWLWTPGKGLIDPGQVAYKEGQMATWDKEKKAYNLSDAQPLPQGFYIWCVLVWDSQGVNIIGASRELPINIQ